MAKPVLRIPRVMVKKIFVQRITESFSSKKLNQSNTIGFNCLATQSNAKRMLHNRVGYNGGKHNARE
ncbi:hypothetical protein BpHYR1_030380 [Brachionus plicatilis]|uniref:Uncharacterized protein n=1 Tax=Brachionus plicatilis TaxID=10195 RepID=A0A3M7SHR0_BRAPC|nr:hypothetical protein BpHYR1_030380 [Brachionus plicatilis]